MSLFTSLLRAALPIYVFGRAYDLRIALVSLIVFAADPTAVSAPMAALNTTFGRTNGLTYTGSLAGSDTLVATLTDNGNSGLGGSKTNIQQSAITVTGTGGGATVDSWRMQYFSANDLATPSLESTVWGDTADPDRDGRINLMEYALGLNPVSREGTDTAIVSSEPDGGIQISTLGADAGYQEDRRRADLADLVQLARKCGPNDQPSIATQLTGPLRDLDIQGPVSE